MHEIVFLTAILWIIGLMVICVAQIVRGKTSVARVLALDTFILLLVGALAVFSLGERSAYYLDAAIVTALLSTAVTLAASHYTQSRRIF